MAKGKFTLGVLFGAVAGVAAGMLTAPKSGKETRKDIKNKANELKGRTEEIAKDTKKKAEKKFDQLKDGAEKKFDKFKKDAEKVGDEAREEVEKAKKKF